MTKTENGLRNTPVTLAPKFKLSFDSPLYDLVDLCDVVRQQENDGSFTPALTKVIGQYAEHGIQVHAVIMRDGAQYGFKENSEDAALSFSEKVVDACNWRSSEPDQIFIFINKEPEGAARRSYAFLHTEGEARVRIPDYKVDAAAPAFVKEFRDSSTPWQDDLAFYLEEVYPFQITSGVTPAFPIQDTPSSSGTIQPEKPGAPINKPLVFGLPALAVALGAIGGRQYGRHKAKQLIEATEAQLKEALDNVAVFTASENLLANTIAILKEKDIPKEKALLEKVELHGIALKQALEELESTRVQNLRYRVPVTRVSRVREDTERLSRIAQAANTDALQLAKDAERLQDLMKNIKTLEANFDKLVDDIQGLIEQRKTEGWDMTAYMDERSSYEATEAKVDEMLAELLVVQPSELMDDVDDQIKQTVTEIHLLPDRLAKMARDFSQQGETIKSSMALIGSAKSTLLHIKELFDPSCFEDIKNNANDFDDRSKLMIECNRDAEPKISKLDAQMVIDTEALDAKFDNAKSEIDAIAAFIEDRNETLNTLVEVLPIQYADLGEHIAGNIKFALAAGSDVEENTKNEMEQLSSEISTATADLKDAKPKYLELNSKRESLEMQCVAIRNRAEQELQEMIDLRDELNRKHRQAESDLRQLDSEVSHSDVESSTRSQASSIRISSINDKDTRQGLKDQINDLDSDINKIRSVSAQAQRDIEEARQQRIREQQERERREREQREAAAQRFDSDGGGRNSGGGGIEL